MKSPRHLRLLQAFLCLMCLITIDLSTSLAQSPWTQKADMLYRTYNPSACMLDGKLYVMGGLDRYSTQDTNYALDSVSVYDPEQDSWSLMANMPNNRCNFSSCVYNGKIFAIGGSRSLYHTPVSAIDAYDPVSDTWSHLTDIPLAGNFQSAALLDDKIYVFSGAILDSDTPYDNLQIYNILTDTWSEGAKMPTPRYDGSAIALNDKIYVIGGEAGDYLGMTTVDVYDPATDSWEPGKDIIFPRKWHENCLLDGRIYVFGGLSGSCSDWHSGGELYDPVLDTWREITPNFKIIGPNAIAPHNGKIYVCGGDVSTCNANHTYDVKSLYFYDPHYDLYPLVNDISVDRNAVNAGSDSVLISTRMHNPTGITLMAKLNKLEGFPIDSIHLFDDGNHNDGYAGDSLFANTWPVSSTEELQYSIDINVTRTDTVAVFNQFNNREVLTTTGLVTVESFINKDSTCNSILGTCNWATLTLRNNSFQYPASQIDVKLESLDSLVWVYNPSLSFERILAGQKTVPSNLRLIISEDINGSRDIPIVVHLNSYDHEFRRDTISISIHVTTDNSLSDYISPIRIFPNPTRGWITIEKEEMGESILKLHNLNGQLIQQEVMDGTACQLDLSSFRKGIYFITIRSKDFVTTRKIIKL